MIIFRCPPPLTKESPFHTTVHFCIAQWAYSNHPRDASYSSSLSRCTPPEPVFLFFCTAPTAARLTYIPVARCRRWGGDGTVGALSLENVGYPRVYVVIVMPGLITGTHPPSFPPLPSPPSPVCFAFQRSWDRWARRL